MDFPRGSAATLHTSARNWGGAIGDFSFALVFAPRLAAACFYCVVAWQAKGESKDALADFTRVL